MVRVKYSFWYLPYTVSSPAFWYLYFYKSPFESRSFRNGKNQRIRNSGTEKSIRSRKYSQKEGD